MSNPFDALLGQNNDQNNGQNVDNENKHLEQNIENIDKKLKLDIKFTDKELKTNEFLVSIFRFVVNNISFDDKNENDSKVSLKCVSLIEENESEKSLKSPNTETLLSFDTLDQFLCERLMLSDINNCLIDYKIDRHLVNNTFPTNECQQKVLYYLYECFHRIETMDSSFISTQQKIQLRDIVVNQSSLIVCHPELDYNFDQNSKDSQLLQLLEDFDYDLDHKNLLQSFIVRIFDRIEAKCQSGDEEVNPQMALKPIYEALRQRLIHTSLIDPNLIRTLKSLNYLVLSGNLCKAMICLNEPQTNNLMYGTNPYQNTLFGLTLSISCLPRPLNNKLEFFLNPSNYSQSEHDVTEKNLGLQINLLTKEMHSIFFSLLKQQESRSATINWIEDCLHSFRDRAKMWTNEILALTGNAQNSSDGFMINLSSVLLRLCKPFCIPVTPKLLKVDSRYCRLKKLGQKSYLEAIASDPFLRPSDQSINEQKFEPNFMTQCFVATHKALHLGFRVVHERFLKLVQDLNQIQHLYHEATSQSNDSEAVQVLRKRMDQRMNQFLSLKTMLSETEFLETSLNFHISSAIWLNNLALNTNEVEASKEFKVISLSINQNIESECLKSVPEFIVENVSDFIIFVRRFNEKTFSLPNIDLKPLMSMIIIFMGSPNRMKNPHLRAKLAEMLESLMPSQTNPNSILFSFGANTEKLFTEHPLSSELVATLIHVFVSIEISEASGESVAFEQKFSYRRPMYIVLKYLWKNESHSNRMKELAAYAEHNMDAMVPPLFLRFINLLMNDAIFLLDEALSYMSKLREMQKQKESGQWQQLPPQQRQENEISFQQTGRMAKIHNIIGRDTIDTLCWITEGIKTIFCHKTLVDRMAAMLNYFLFHLVGKQSRNFKVKDFNEYDFRPKDTLRDICQIYVNLFTNNEMSRRFCSAISRDERSYSKKLFEDTENALMKTTNYELSVKIKELSEEVNILLQKRKHHEIDPSEVPEEFLDPIMNTLMSDPVILPNSGQRVDRKTISRHLLSDQTDPFTRSPLTMDLVVADIELKERIKAFVEKKLSSKLNE